MAQSRAEGTGLRPSSLAQNTVWRLMRLSTVPTDEGGLNAITRQLMDWTALDHFRRTSTRAKHEHRAGDACLSVHGSPDGHSHAPSTEHIPLQHALGELDAVAPRQAEVLLLAIVAGMTHDQIATALELSTKTVQRDLAFARAWLAARIDLSAERPSREDGR
jgi:DNA-directed RNA polymerase specialized sigma24 family protein